MANNTFTIDGRMIGPGTPPYIIAEMSGNHNGDIERAFALIAAAKNAGADAVKIQTYTADTITIDSDRDDFKIKGGLWDGRTLYELYQEAHTPWDWHEALFAKGRELGITVFSSPFDATAIELLESLGAPAYKIASFEAIDLPLIAKVAATGKPMIISTGMADADEIGEALGAAREGGCKDVALLHCVSSYPAKSEEYNLQTIPDMATRFNVPIGLSDHTLSNTTAIASVALGACIIEKHFTLARADGGPDSTFSLQPDELAALCTQSRVAFDALGSVNYERKPGERDNLKFRRSLYAVADIAKGETFTEQNVRSIRPGFGMAPKLLPDVLGKQAAKAIARGEALSAEHIKKD